MTYGIWNFFLNKKSPQSNEKTKSDLVELTVITLNHNNNIKRLAVIIILKKRDHVLKNCRFFLNVNEQENIKKGFHLLWKVLFQGFAFKRYEWLINSNDTNSKAIKSFIVFSAAVT